MPLYTEKPLNKINEMFSGKSGIPQAPYTVYSLPSKLFLNLDLPHSKLR